MATPLRLRSTQVEFPIGVIGIIGRGRNLQAPDAPALRSAAALPQAYTPASRFQKARNQKKATPARAMRL
jgi:hypothetical protein